LSAVNAPNFIGDYEKSEAEIFGDEAHR